MDVHTHTQPRKENNAPDTTKSQYPILPPRLLGLNHGPLYENRSTAPPPVSPSSRTITASASNISRRRSKKKQQQLSKLTETPPRSSYAMQMRGHWMHTASPKPEKKTYAQVAAEPNSAASQPQLQLQQRTKFPSARPDLRRRDGLLSPKSTDDENDGEEDPALTDLERAVALQFDSHSPSREERRKTLFIASQKTTQQAQIESEPQQPSPSSSDSWTGDDVFLERNKWRSLPFEVEEEELQAAVQRQREQEWPGARARARVPVTSTSTSSSIWTADLPLTRPAATDWSTATTSITSFQSSSSSASSRTQPASYPRLPQLNPHHPILNAAARWAPKSSRFCVPTRLKAVERRDEEEKGLGSMEMEHERECGVGREHESSDDADDEDEGEGSSEGVGAE